MKHWKKTRYR